MRKTRTTAFFSACYLRLCTVFGDGLFSALIRRVIWDLCEAATNLLLKDFFTLAYVVLEDEFYSTAVFGIAFAEEPIAKEATENIVIHSSKLRTEFPETWIWMTINTNDRLVVYSHKILYAQP